MLSEEIQKKLDEIEPIGEREEGYHYIASWSGGKDSTFMVDQLLRNGDPLDLVIFANTGYEFKEMYEYIDKVSEYWKSKYDVEIVMLNRGEEGKAIWKKWAEGNFTKGQYVGMPRGFPFSLGMSWCTRELKIRPMDKFIAEKYGKDAKIKRYVGIAADEPKRITDDPDLIYPIHAWGIIEKEVEDILIERGLHNPLYNHFARTGCFLCPKQNLQSLFKLWKYYPEEWAEMKALRNRYRDMGAAITQIKYYEIEDLEERFKKLEAEGKEPSPNREEEIEIGCFCK